MEKSVYRIIDANYNRCREGLRTVEEFCRFSLNNQNLSSRCKQIRHKLSCEIEKLGTAKLLVCRDSRNDVGCNVKIENPMQKNNLTDCAAAGLARATEALRVICEATSTIADQNHLPFENLRFDCYNLQKDIALFGEPATRFANTRLYGILTAQDNVDVLKITEDCAAAGADCLQLRAKNIRGGDAELLKLAKDFVKICNNNNVISIINDRIDIAISSDADGVHLGQNDLPLETVRKCQLKPMLIGTSTHCMAELQTAASQMPHYVGLGCVFDSSTKQNVNVCGLDYLKKAVEYLKAFGIRPVAIGGINIKNIEDVLKTGVKTIAVSGELCNAQNPAQICRQLTEIINRHL